MSRLGFLDLGLDTEFPLAFKIDSFSFYNSFNRNGFQSPVCPGLDSQIWVWILLVHSPSQLLNCPSTFLLTELDFRALCHLAWTLRSGRAWILRLALDSVSSPTFKIDSSSFYVSFTQIGFQSFVCRRPDSQIWAGLNS